MERRIVAVIGGVAAAVTLVAGTGAVLALDAGDPRPTARTESIAEETSTTVEQTATTVAVTVTTIEVTVTTNPTASMPTAPSANRQLELPTPPPPVPSGDTAEGTPRTVCFYDVGGSRPMNPDGTCPPPLPLPPEIPADTIVTPPSE